MDYQDTVSIMDMIDKPIGKMVTLKQPKVRLGKEYRYACLECKGIFSVFVSECPYCDLVRTKESLGLDTTFIKHPQSYFTKIERAKNKIAREKAREIRLREKEEKKKILLERRKANMYKTFTFSSYNPHAKRKSPEYYQRERQRRLHIIKRNQRWLSEA